MSNTIHPLSEPPKFHGVWNPGSKGIAQPCIPVTLNETETRSPSRTRDWNVLFPLVNFGSSGEGGAIRDRPAKERESELVVCKSRFYDVMRSEDVL